MDLDKELTNKFLSGEMSFADYSSQWYGDEDLDEAEEVDQVNESEIPAKARPTRRRRCTRLTPALLGLMGEANLRLARGDVEMAERMCHEIIKQMPTASEPYQTLAQIHEHDADKSLQFSLLAAHLNPSNSNEWLRLAAISEKRNDFRQEMICYTHAIRADKGNLDNHLKRLELIDKLEEYKFPINNLNMSRVRCYHKIVSYLTPSDGEVIMKYAKLAATMYHNNNEKDKAVEVMTKAYNKCSNLFQLEDLNIYLELLISQKQFTRCLEVFVASIGVDIEAEIQTVRNSNNEIEEHTNYVRCSIPNNLAIDLKCKLLVCFIYLKAMNLVQTLMDEFLKNDVETAGDLYMDIEEAFSAVGYHEMAMQMLQPLVKTTNFDLGAVWLKYANCLCSLGRVDEAVNAFHKVLDHAPQHPDARNRLFEILEQKGCIDDALNALKQDFNYVVSPSLLYKYCSALKQYNRIPQYVDAGEALLSRNTTKFRHQEELRIAYRIKGGIETIQDLRAMRGEPLHHDDDIQFEDEDFKLTPQQVWDMFRDLLQTAYDLKLYPTMQRLTFNALITKELAPFRKEIDFFVFQACLLNGDYTHAMRFVREYTPRQPSNRMWNMLSLVLVSLGDFAQIKYLTRLFQKGHGHGVKNLFLGNHYLVSGRYLVALKYYLEYHEQVREPLSAFLIAITLLAMGAQKTVDKHHNLILQAMAYMSTYNKLRKCDQEAYYNMGRFYQVLNINNLAVEYYEKALACGHVTECSYHGVIDLRKEIAYNLHLLYREHSPDLARKILLQHLVIE
ncbi:general transcription factor 3C polypeptide 3-like isoform X2 [Leptidea sinapis]|uniref:general transcription factor 3C polypeptide 3-like isoform X2 n=1 Tax=Leptidea sinapis TaxID=189913 RepID=UPI002145CF8D|nr:general transcription factor 3C polypeptide 3-like isoform X2 [Leptidea sinapis]